MFKKYFDFLTDRFIEMYQSAIKTDEYLSEYRDRIIVWVVSLSTGSIVLMLSYSERTGLSKSFINATIILLLLSVLTGFISRLLHFEAVKVGKEFLSTFEFDLKLSQLQFYPRQLTNQDSVDSIYQYIDDDFDFPFEKYTGIQSRDEFLKNHTVDSAKKAYETVRLYCENHMKCAQDETQKVLDKALHKKENPSLKPNKQPTEQDVAQKTRLAKIFQLICMTGFVSALLTISISYMAK